MPKKANSLGSSVSRRVLDLFIFVESKYIFLREDQTRKRGYRSLLASWGTLNWRSILKILRGTFNCFRLHVYAHGAFSCGPEAELMVSVISDDENRLEMAMDEAKERGICVRYELQILNDAIVRVRLGLYGSLESHSTLYRSVQFPRENCKHGANGCRKFAGVIPDLR